MSQTTDAIVQQLSTVITACESVMDLVQHDGTSSSYWIQVSENSVRALAAIQRVAHIGSSHRVAADAITKQYGVCNVYGLRQLIGILRALREDYKAGFLASVTQLIHADVFADFLEMADHLLDQGYKDAAAVMTGAVLEEHLRKLCLNSGIQVESEKKPKKADSLNAELAGTGVYSKLDQKNITAWLDLRNKAAHGRYSEYTKEQVQALHDGARHFMSRYPA
jgi:hypothetical protein